MHIYIYIYIQHNFDTNHLAMQTNGGTLLSHAYGRGGRFGHAVLTSHGPDCRPDLIVLF